MNTCNLSFSHEGKRLFTSDKSFLSGLGKGAAQQGPIAPGRMVRILANGEIVQDDDPRVRNTIPSRSNTPRQVGAQRPWQEQLASCPLRQ